MTVYEKRFRSRIKKTPTCWLWTAGAFGDGYAAFYDGNAMVRASRYSYELETGKKLGKLFACHTCDNPRCVRPSHLFPSDSAGNLADMARKNRSTHGSRNPRAITDEATVLAIRIRYANGGQTIKSLAAEHGMPKSTMHAILKGVNWTRVPCPRPKRMMTRWHSNTKL